MNSIIPLIVGFLLAYALFFWRYNKELNIRSKWMSKTLNGKGKGRWKYPLALIIALELSFAITTTIFGIVPDTFIFKSFFISFCFVPFFILLIYKFFYEMIGGKRKWKL